MKKKDKPVAILTIKKEKTQNMIRNKTGHYYQSYRNKKNHKGVLSKSVCQSDILDEMDTFLERQPIKHDSRRKI